jgi:hypothetical protein
MNQNAKKLLRDHFVLDYDRNLIRECIEKDPRAQVVLSGIIQRADCENQNKRIYPFPILQREVENYQKMVREGRAVGELDHPESSIVSYKNASHVMRELWWEGKDVKAKVELLDTPEGDRVRALLKAGVPIGISSRGVGSTKENHSGFDVVQEDFQIICWDIVAEPSTPGAFLMTEGRVPAPTFEKADRIFRALNDIVIGKGIL